MPQFRLMRRDIEILRTVNDCQALTVAQLQKIFWNSANPTYTTLRRLRHAGYLKDFNEDNQDNPISDGMILYCTPQAMTLLRQKLDLLDEEINKPPFKVLRNHNSRQTLLSVNDVRATFLRAGRDSADFHVREWIIENHFRSQPDYVRVRRKDKPVYPDALMHLETPDFYSYCYIEVDSGTERLEDVKAQLEVYHAYMRSDLHRQRFDSEGFRVLIISTGARRLKGIIAKAHEVGISGHFWFTSKDKLVSESLFTDKIWQQFSQGGARWLSLGDQ